MKKTLKNSQMAQMLKQLKPILAQRNKVGYAAARNSRILSDHLTEYQTFRTGLIEKYGQPEKDEQGNTVIRMKTDSEEFQQFCKELAPINEIEHEVDFMTIPYEEAIGVLSGEEILAVDWMFVDDDSDD